jgi:hypothetical protein
MTLHVHPLGMGKARLMCCSVECLCGLRGQRAFGLCAVWVGVLVGFEAVSGSLAFVVFFGLLLGVFFVYCLCI